MLSPTIHPESAAMLSVPEIWKRKKQSAAARQPALDVQRRCHGHSRLTKRRESMDDLLSKPSSSGSCEEQVRRLHDLLYLLNCRGLRTRLADLKSIISTYQPACVALQGDISEEYHDILKILWQTRTEWNEVVSDGFFTIGMMTQRTAPRGKLALERTFEHLRIFGLVIWGLGDDDDC
ncbi:hypothetical protein TNCV_3677911 [Trichonephila clavipes]|nr:hypothetical protein TNCV_3677911 [Trichonephila clavipes]